ncbi:hypothetical protein H310_13024 [Aphanomyces invadans]|uniref:Uncharacterized protein n=1 Tax=Aphanomyces invadans TaxID=157072 RepID=A0A024TF76_9STRA|nr:hypothetical protein H310_13024 [Aphanomyces invadans]ETV92810.1 hypothetical protein H310_13024 [Aphanomyces invadans]|eukprot:XP_008878580.1 hypothetical protein H310_13024 [Aphanomyces invadans]
MGSSINIVGGEGEKKRKADEISEAAEKLLRERREEEAARKAEEAERAAQEKQRRLREVEAAARAQSAELSGAATTTWKSEEPATMFNLWTTRPKRSMDGVGKTTFDYVCRATSDVNFVDEADKAGMPARVFEANA